MVFEIYRAIKTMKKVVYFTASACEASRHIKE